MGESTDTISLAAEGFSARDDAYAAGAEAARGALDGLGDTSPGVLLVFAAIRFDHEALLEGIASVAPGIPLVGGTTAGEISGHGVTSDSVVILALKSGPLRFIAGIGTELSRDENAAVRQMAEQMFSVKQHSDAYSLLVFPSGLGCNVLKTIDGLYDCFGERFEIAGGYPGSNDFYQPAYQYLNGRVYTDAIVGVLVCHDEDCRIGIGICDGFESMGNSFRCTSSCGNILKEFDDIPALKLYREILGEERSARIPEVFVEYPFGLIDENASSAGKTYFQLRYGLRANEDDASISLTASIPQGSRVTLTAGTRRDLIRGVENAARRAALYLGDYTPKALLMFSCIGRSMVLGSHLGEEVSVVKKIVGSDVPIAGFYTFGEVGPIDKTVPHLASAKYHNASVVVWILGSRPDQRRSDDNDISRQASLTS